MLDRRDTSEPMHVPTCTYLLIQSANLISSRGDYSRAASISFRACSGVATIRERRLFESGIYSVIWGLMELDPVNRQRGPPGGVMWGWSLRMRVVV